MECLDVTPKMRAMALLLVWQFCAVGIGAVAADAPRRHPNILFVFSDEHSRDMVGCYGNTQIITPNFDRLAARGVRFDYCFSSYPVCTPYRSMLFSGQHVLRNGCLENDLRLLPSAGPFLGEALRDAGYSMGYIGKWHLYGGPRDRPIAPGPTRYGFDGPFLSNNCHIGYEAGKCFYWDEAGKKVFFQEWEPYGQTHQALEFIDRGPKDKPFALFISWHPPHDNKKIKGDPYPFGYDAPEELLAKYDPKTIRLRPNVDDTPMRRLQYQGHMAMITGIDIAFGWLLDKLKERGLEENTLVVFTSDHGDMLHSQDAPGPKPAIEDGAARVPLIIRWPGVMAAGRRSDLLVGTLDLMPTLLGLAGVPVPKTCQGKDLSKAMIEGRDDAVESVPYFVTPLGARGVFTRDFSYARTAEDAPGLRKFCDKLYGRRNDPYQQHNLFDDPAAAELKSKMEKLTQQWLDRFEDRWWTQREIRGVVLGGKNLHDLIWKEKKELLLDSSPLEMLKASAK